MKRSLKTRKNKKYRGGIGVMHSTRKTNGETRVPFGSRHTSDSGNTRVISNRRRGSSGRKSKIDTRISSGRMAKTETKFVRTYSKLTQKRATKTIGTFMKKTENKRRSMFLQAICSDSGVCIAFGKERKKILDFFNGFNKFDYLKSVKAIGAVSANGFVKELEYEREGYKAYAVLKSSRTKNADNLLYEFFVGYVINKTTLNLVPSFIETYGHYRYKNESDWAQFQGKTPSNIILNDILLPYNKGEILYGEACKYSKTICILTQHIKGAESIGDKIYKGVPDFDFIINDLVSSLYQIYYTLSLLKTDFTHYDLHPNNVILYKPVHGKYIEFHYHLKDGSTVTFKSQYISKIIDYGRCYINRKGVSSDEHYRDLCRSKMCNTGSEKCGDESGNGWLEPPPQKEDHYICSTVSNRSHDLRLLKNLSTEIPWYKEPLKSNTRIRDHLKIIFATNRLEYEVDYGTPPVVGKLDGVKIEDVADAEFCIRRIMQNGDQKAANESYYNGMTKLGELHVYGSKSMEYISA